MSVSERPLRDDDLTRADADTLERGRRLGYIINRPMAVDLIDDGDPVAQIYWAWCRRHHHRLIALWPHGDGTAALRIDFAPLFWTIAEADLERIARMLGPSAEWCRGRRSGVQIDEIPEAKAHRLALYLTDAEFRPADIWRPTPPAPPRPPRPWSEVVEDVFDGPDPPDSGPSEAG